jgi:GNAT superfamily N-acetyltransferase
MSSPSEQVSPAPAPVAAVRRARLEDVPTLAPMLARAYMDDPVAVWACRPPALRRKMLENLYVARLNQLLAHEEVWTDPELTSAALWSPPGRRQSGIGLDFALVRTFLHPRLMARAPLQAIGRRGVQRRHPRHPPHWYLSLLGTDPDARGRGLGSAVLRPVLERCDSDGVGIYLESSKLDNLDFYARFGFRVTGELRLPRGPRMWPMWREPAGAAGLA